MENNVCEGNEGGNHSVWKILYKLFDVFAEVEKFEFSFIPGDVPQTGSLDLQYTDLFLKTHPLLSIY